MPQRNPSVDLEQKKADLQARLTHSLQSIKINPTDSDKKKKHIDALKNSIIVCQDALLQNSAPYVLKLSFANSLKNIIQKMFSQASTIKPNFRLFPDWSTPLYKSIRKLSDHIKKIDLQEEISSVINHLFELHDYLTLNCDSYFAQTRYSEILLTMENETDYPKI